MSRSLLAALATLAGGLALLSIRAGAVAPTEIRLGYTNVSGYTGMFVAKDQGMFEKRGLAVDPVLIAVSSTMPAALIGGSLQIAGPTSPVFLQAVEGGIDIVIIAGCAVNDTRQLGQGVVARQGVQIKTAKDFEGKRVGVPGLGSYMQVMFRRWLTDKGADDRKVNFVEVPFAQGGDILRSGNIDAMLTTDPYYTRILESKSGYLVAYYLTEMPDGLFSIFYAATREWAVKNRPAITAFRAALEEADGFIAAQPAKSREILGRALRLPPDAMATIVIPKLKVKVQPSDVKYWIDTLVAQGVTKTRPDPSKLIVN